MDWKKLGKALLFPHIAIMILLVPIATVLLVGSMVFIGTESPIAIVSYVISAYTLTVWCFKIPYLVEFFKTLKSENRYIRRWFEDERLRMNVSLYGAMGWNVLYGLFQLWLGFYHRTFWFYSFGIYYICLAAMRFFLVRHTVRNKPGQKMRDELVKYRLCGWIFLFMNLALTAIVFFMVYWNRTFIHHMITSIAMAAYTFTAFTLAVINIVKYRKYNSPIYNASKSVSLTAACVSILTLESTMLTTFSDGTMDPAARRLMLGLTGAAVLGIVLLMAVYMIIESTRQLRELKLQEKNDGE